MNLPCQLLVNCNLSLAGFKGVSTRQTDAVQIALDPTCGSGVFPRTAARENVGKVLLNTQTS